MRVLQVIDSLLIGGAEVLVRDMAPRFLARGLDCDVVVLSRSSNDLERSLQFAGVKLLDTGPIGLYSPRQIRALASAMRGYDVVHVHLFPAQLWAVLAARLQRVPALVTTEHNTWNARRRWWLRPLDAWMYPRYGRIACNSEATAKSLARWCPHVKGQLRVVSNGIVLDTFANSGAADLSGIGEGRIRAAFVGRFEPQKDHATLLRALKLAPRIHLFLLGDGPLREQLEQQSRDLGISDRITFMGFRSDVPQVLKACDFYVHSTTSDGFGIAACEAMAAGLPVIASDVPGLAQVVQGAGILVSVGDHESLAREMNGVAGSLEKRQQMSQASRRRARDFSIERTVDGYVAMYESVLHQAPRQKVGV
ncbi:MAG: glycosyltransferase [Acidobacteriaceae bacterium]|nr:glycosyltransferase [Acidobacteriaceae bacterium]MBV9499269.1 glycosyltransferase [Acidobacteriaceae bacterium]